MTKVEKITEKYADQPPQPGVAEVTTGRTTKHVAICTACGASDATYRTKKTAQIVAADHVRREHG